jgi:hypothetical protein
MILFIVGSFDEMCVHMFYYFPVVPGFDACGYFRVADNATEGVTVCGGRSDVFEEWVCHFIQKLDNNIFPL